MKSRSSGMSFWSAAAAAFRCVLAQVRQRRFQGRGDRGQGRADLAGEPLEVDQRRPEVVRHDVGELPHLFVGALHAGRFGLERLLGAFLIGDVADRSQDIYLSGLFHPAYEHVGGKFLAVKPLVRPLEEAVSFAHGRLNHLSGLLGGQAAVRLPFGGKIPGLVLDKLLLTFRSEHRHRRRVPGCETPGGRRPGHQGLGRAFKENSEPLLRQAAIAHVANDVDKLLDGPVVFQDGKSADAEPASRAAGLGPLGVRRLPRAEGFVQQAVGMR